jgi:hypothetical protein
MVSGARSSLGPRRLRLGMKTDRIRTDTADIDTDSFSFSN